MKPKMRSIEIKSSVSSSTKSNRLFWILIIFLLCVGVIANFYFESVNWAIRVACGIVLTSILIALALQTVEGKKAWAFIKSARAELRKVVWPTRRETIHTTMVVVVMVIVTALFLWGIDSLFLWLISFLTGQRG